MNRTALVFIALSFAAGITVSPWVIPSVQAQYRPVKTTPLMRTDLGAWCDGKEVTVDIQEFGPGTSGMHYHPAHSFAWIIEGSEVKTVQGKPPVVAKAGQMFYEGPMEVHETHNDAPVKVLLLRIAEKGKPVTTRVP